MNNTQVGKTITFIPTAANPEKIKFFVDSDKKELRKIGIIIDEVDISKVDKQTVEQKLINNDLIFISGGNTFYLLQELKRTGTDMLLVEEIMKGKQYIGSSAGSIILSNNIEYIKGMDSPKKAPLLTNFSSLGVVEFNILPHYQNAPFKNAAKIIIDEYATKIDIKPISNNQVIIVKDDYVVLKSI